jgi:hypothetical protein
LLIVMVSGIFWGFSLSHNLQVVVMLAFDVVV